jgi:NAD-dependent deacetylase
MTLAEILLNSSRIVFFGGAGVSTESKIPDFRGTDGLYAKKNQKKYPYPAETMLSHSFYVQHPKEFFDFYFNEMIYQDAVPNKAHYALAQLEKDGKLSAVITQNIDGLHQKAGSLNVLELHGSVLRNYCTRCHTPYTLEETIEYRNSDGIPVCPKDGGIIKPDVVLYEEGLDSDTLTNAVMEIAKADCLIVGGTSLTVYPAAGLLQYFHGKYLVVINKDPVGSTYRTPDLVLHTPIGETLDAAVKEMQQLEKEKEQEK